MTTSATEPGVLQFSPNIPPGVHRLLLRASDAFDRLLGPRGYARCPEHGVDHTGKTARSIVINCALHAATGDERFLERAVRVAHLLCSRLWPDDSAGGAWIFFPGRHSASNNSTNIIDNGECVDALATLLTYARDALREIDRDRLTETITRCCHTYLVGNVVDKPIINQRLWGAMGLASAYAALAEPTWASAVEASVARSLDEMRDDGSFPYVTDAASIGEHEGSADLTVHYHGRCIAFARFALDAIGQAATYADRLALGVDFLAAVLRPDGLKPLLLEGKRWFWDSDTEAGSLPYDAYALVADGRPRLRALAHTVLRRSVNAQSDAGWIDATLRPAFICRLFHTADLAWIARACAVVDLGVPMPPPEVPDVHAPVRVSSLEPSGVVRIESSESVALARIAKRPADDLVGGRIGGGGLVYVGHRAAGWPSVLRHIPEPDPPEGTWVYDPGFSGLWLIGLPRLRDRAVRFRLHVARSHWKSGRRAYALRMLARHLGPRGWLGTRRYQSNWTTVAGIEAATDGVVVRASLARMDGTLLRGVSVERDYRLDADGLSVRELLRTERVLHDLRYVCPRAMRLLDVTAGGPWRRERGSIIVGPLLPGATVDLLYRL